MVKCANTIKDTDTISLNFHEYCKAMDKYSGEQNVKLIVNDISYIII